MEFGNYILFVGLFILIAAIVTCFVLLVKLQNDVTIFKGYINARLEGPTGPTGSEGAMGATGPGAEEINFPIEVSSGGTSLTTLTQNGLLLGQGTNAVAFVGPSTETYLPLTSNGALSAPLFSPGLTAYRVIRSTNISGNYTLALTDANYKIMVTAAADITIPLDDDVLFPIGTEIEFWQTTSANFLLVASVGVTIGSPYGNLRSLTQYSAVIITKVAANTWYAAGSLTTI